MIHHKLIAFDRPLTGATIPGHSAGSTRNPRSRRFARKAYQEGSDAARSIRGQQLVEFRAEVQALAGRTFPKTRRDRSLKCLSQLRETLPSLAVEIARRLLAGFEPTR